MVNTSLKPATEISSVERKFILRLISQLYVIVSRVKYLIQFYFIGHKETLPAIQEILLKRDIADERLFNLFKELRGAAAPNGPGVVQGLRYLRNHFEVPKTSDVVCSF